MAYFPDVSKGDKFKPNTLLSNNVRRIVNSVNGFKSPGVTGTHSGMVRIQVYNNTSSSIAAGTAVNFSDSAQMVGNAVPAEPLKDPAKPWGVVTQLLKAKAMGDCIISGPATVTVSGTGDYAEPSKDKPAVFTRGTTGAPVIFASATKAVINLGASSQQDLYDGPFAMSYDAEKKKLTVAMGYCLRNGDFDNVAKKELTPATGTVCVNSTMNSDGSWTTPEIKFATPSAANYPVGNCKVTGETVAFCSYRVPVAIFIVTAICDT